MKRLRPCSIILMFWFGATVATAADAGAPREVLSLNGTWSIAEGTMDTVPASFDRTVPVPGLVTLASPAFTPVPGPKGRRSQGLSAEGPPRATHFGIAAPSDSNRRCRPWPGSRSPKPCSVRR
jgi:hypothetical protein